MVAARITSDLQNFSQGRAAQMLFNTRSEHFQRRSCLALGSTSLELSVPATVTLPISSNSGRCTTLYFDCGCKRRKIAIWPPPKQGSLCSAGKVKQSQAIISLDISPNLTRKSISLSQIMRLTATTPATLATQKQARDPFPRAGSIVLRVPYSHPAPKKREKLFVHAF